MKQIIIEVAAFTPSAAIAAAHSGAHRIEMCSGYAEGGLSPSAGAIQKVRQSIAVPLHVMIRPRIGDFVYDRYEKEVIFSDIDFCKRQGADGVVVGALTSSGEVDVDFIRKVVQASCPMSVTFHRAFDIAHDQFTALDQLIDCGVKRILTSGGKPTAAEGIEVISKLTAKAGNKLIILPGGGINPQNVQDIVSKTNATEIHFSAKTLVQSPMKKNRLSLTSYGEVSDTQWYECEPDLIREMIEKCSG